MSNEIKVPDIGDFKDVPVIEVHVKPGQAIKADETLITLESDKATLDVPAPADGVVGEVKVKTGDKVSQGSVDPDARRRGAPRPRPRSPPQPRRPAPRRPRRRGGDLHAEVLVLGAGPGGYSAAFRAADLGKKVVLVERWADARRRLPECRLHPLQGAAARRQSDRRGRRLWPRTASASARRTSISTSCAAGRTASSRKLTGGLAALAKQRKVKVVTARAASPRRITLR